MAYNYQKFDAKDYDFASFRGPLPGAKAPDLTIDLANGGTTRLLEFDGDFLVLEMGSLTCPLFQGRRRAMEQLDRTQPNISFAVLYVREAHPGAKIGAHATQDDKQSCALHLAGEDRRVILVDDLDGTAHAAFGSYPNSVFILNRGGCVVYASDWNNPSTTAQALKQLMAGQPAQARAWFKPVTPAVLYHTFVNGGRGSAMDFVRSFPRLFWNNLIVRNFRLLRGRDPGVAPDTGC